MTRIERSYGRKSVMRASRRGAAVVEALITTGVITVALGSGMLVHEAYQRKLELMGRVRNEVWQEAMRGCGAPPDHNSMASAAMSFQGGPPSVSADTVSTWFGVTKRSGAGTQVVEITRLSGTNPTSVQRTLRTRHSVACNEVAIDGSGVLGLFRVFRSLAE